MWNYLENNNNTVKYLDVTTNEAFSKDSKNLEIYLEFSLGFLGQSHVNNVFLSTYSRLPNKQCLLNIHGCLSLMIFFFHSRTVSGVFLPNFISSFLIKGEGSSMQNVKSKTVIRASPFIRKARVSRTYPMRHKWCTYDEEMKLEIYFQIPSQRKCAMVGIKVFENLFLAKNK